jgi:hypothetical protein
VIVRTPVECSWIIKFVHKYVFQAIQAGYNIITDLQCTFLKDTERVTHMCLIVMFVFFNFQKYILFLVFI